ncbi:MAG: CDP-alcohol phosphatidyltransferase family protein [Tannerellaceae bacterium]|jgi:phosphatidylglycerophosphate synthase|nr:CDP-alcohol phosphatidyltransferase family protein [Tannerellaceae bacterium]
MDKEYEASLKSIETENLLDKLFYRPLGFLIAKKLRHTSVTPNAVTFLSIFVGVAGACLFFFNDLSLNLLGVACLVFANILDCVDGQLARLTGIKSPFGRILDGLAGDLWFLTIYTSLVLRLHQQTGSWIFLPVALCSALSHLFQANITDYYKTLHLYFISPQAGAEFQTAQQVEDAHSRRPPGLGKAILLLYRLYTLLQIRATPQLQAMLQRLNAAFGDDIPEHIRLHFRQHSARLMHRWVDWLTFNGRSLVLFALLFAFPQALWAYFLFEILLLNLVLFSAIQRHERLCASIGLNP